MTRPTLREWWHRVTGRESFRVRSKFHYQGETLRVTHRTAKRVAKNLAGQVIFDPK